VTAAATAVVLAHGAAHAEQASIDPAAWVRHPQKSFAIAAGEVSVAQYRSCVNAGACAESDLNVQCNYGREGRDDHPVNCVTFDGAQKYCAWAGGRLCTEQEWLDACRGTDGRAFPFGDAFDPDACNVHSNSEAIAGAALDTEPVGSRSSCSGGLDGVYDLAGNVGEWIDGCKDTYCKFRGAGYVSNDPIEHFAGCGGVCSGNQKTLMSNVVGVRCCKDAGE
jgi:formylglycine-generating enzyme required for sulfatase activity